MKDFGKMIQEQKPNGNDVKCAEIKTLHTSANGFSDKLKNVFKIGEYNRATASFEMSSSEDLRQKRKSKKEPYGEGEPCHLFKSSFARSVVMNNTNESKSLDYIYVDRKTNKNDGGKDSENGFWSMPGKEVSVSRIFRVSFAFVLHHLPPTPPGPSLVTVLDFVVLHLLPLHVIHSSGYQVFTLLSQVVQFPSDTYCHHCLEKRKLLQFPFLVFFFIFGLLFQP